MGYTLDFISFFNLVIDYEKVDMTSLALLWSNYSGLAAIMSMALMSTVSIDQFTLIQGSFRQGVRSSGTERNRQRTPFIQFLKYQFLGGTRKEMRLLKGMDKIGSFQFFLYNLGSSLIWLSVIFIAGILARVVLTAYFGRFGPVEFEAIVGILVVYSVGLTGTILLRRLNLNRHS